MNRENHDQDVNKYHKIVSQVMTSQELAAMAKVSQHTAIRWCNEGKVYAEQAINSNIWLIARESAQAFVDKTKGKY